MWSKTGWLQDGGGWGPNVTSGDAALTTAWLGRAVTGGTIGAVLDGTHLAAAKTFLNGLVSDGIDVNFDALYWCATQSIGSDGMDILRANMMQNNFNLTGTGMTFVADRGATDAGGTATFDTHFTPSTASGKYALNDAMLMIWGNTAGNVTDFGWDNGGPTSAVGMASGSTLIAMNQSGTAGFSSATPTGLGFLVGQRTASNNLAGYWAAPNAGSVTSLGTSATASTTLTTGSLNLGAVSGVNYSGSQISFAAIGKSMSSGDVTKFYLRVQALMTAVGN